MSTEKGLPPMPDDAERLFLKVARKETEGHRTTRDLTPEFLRYLGFSTADAVKSAADEIRAFAHYEKWDGGVCLMHVEDGRLVCGPLVVEAWHDFEKRRTV